VASPLIDTHAHLWDRRFDRDRAAAWDRATAAGVTRRLEVGVDLATSQRALEIARDDASVLATAGIHPHEAGASDTVSARDALAELASEERIAAIGECGLDFYRNLSPQDAQEDVFAFQIALARVKKLPLVLHERDAWGPLLACLDAGGAERVGGVFHCFSHGRAKAEEAFARNFVIGLGGTATRNEAWARELLPWVPLERVVLETDSPYLTPASLSRSTRNEPAHLPLVAAAIAEAKGMSADAVAQATTETALRVFGGRAAWTPGAAPART